MAHFAKINRDNVVTQVIVVDNKDIQDLEFPESEPVGQEYIRSLGLDGTWLQTSYNKKFRGNYAGVGFKYESSVDAFIAPKPYPSWVYDKTAYGYKAPVAPPTDNSTMYEWNEASKCWQLIQ